MNDKQQEILQLTQAMFNAAPGAGLLSEFTGFVDNENGSIQELANLLAATNVFKQSMYADSLSSNEFATQFIENTVGALVSAENKAWAVAQVEEQLGAGQSRGNVIYLVANALAAVDTANADWGAAALQFNNKVDVASFYSIDQNGSSNILSVLQQVTADVTNLAASVSAAKALFQTGVSGNVIDGYVSGSTVHVDLDDDHELDLGEISTTTDALGNFAFPPGAEGFGILISTGGTDIATGIPSEGIMAAPAGSSVINSLATLIHYLTEDGTTTVDEATAIVLESLGLNADVDLLNFDPIAESIRTDTDSTAIDIALAIQATDTQVKILISQTAALLSGAGVSADEDAGIESAYAALAALLADTTGAADLTSTTFIAQVIQDAAAEAGADAAQTAVILGLAPDAAQTIANLNTAINDAVTNSSNATNALFQIAAIQIVAEDIEDEMAIGAANGDVSGTTTSTTGTALTNAITAAEASVGDVTGEGLPDPITPPATTTGGGGGGGGGGGETEDQSLDALNGTISSAATFDADSGIFVFSDSVATTSFTNITNFGSDDSISITDFDFDGNNLIVANNGADVVFTVNDNGTVSQITLVDVTLPVEIIGSLSAFNALSLGDVTIS